MQEARFLIAVQTNAGFSYTTPEWGRGEDSKSRTLRHLAQPEYRQPPVAVEVAHLKQAFLNVTQTSTRFQSVDCIWRNASEASVGSPLRMQ